MTSRHPSPLRIVTVSENESQAANYDLGDGFVQALRTAAHRAYVGWRAGGPPEPCNHSPEMCDAFHRAAVLDAHDGSWYLRVNDDRGQDWTFDFGHLDPVDLRHA